MTAISMAPINRAIISIVRAAMVLTPSARPSSPSIRFTELVTATIQITVMGTAMMPKSQYSPPRKGRGLAIISMTTPCQMAMSAATICKINLMPAPRG